MPLNAQQLATQMISAAQGVFSGKWPDVRDYAENEFKNFANDLTFIESKVLSGDMDQDTAQSHIDLQRHSIKTVLIAIEGIGLLLAEQAINAALDAVKTAVNSALPFAAL